MDKCLNMFLSGSFPINCLQLLLSKSLGYLIIFFSFTLKVPQINNMMACKSDKGLSYLSTYLEIIIYVLTIVYAFHNGNPISTYGENIIILIQILAILFLSWNYAEKKGSILFRSIYSIGLIVFVVACVFNIFPEYVWKLIVSLNIPLISIARFLQIWVSYRQKDTAVGGNVSRIFTTVTETKDTVQILTFTYGAILNFIVLIQIYMYGNKSAKVVKQVKTD